jgi:hypothetical protein
MLQQREQVLARTSTRSHHEQAAEQFRTTFGYAIGAFRDLDLASPEEVDAWETAYPGVPPTITRSASRELALRAREKLQEQMDAEIAAVQSAKPADHWGYLKAATLIWVGRFAQLLNEEEAETLHVSLTAHLRKDQP